MIGPLDIDKIRQDTLHCSEKIFLNSAGSSLPPAIVNQTIVDYLKDEERIGGYGLMDQRAADIEGFYSSCAELIHAHPRNIAFANSATDAYGKALSSIPFVEGDIIITSDNDYISNFIQFNTLKERFGIRLKRIKSQDNGDLDIENLQELIEEERPRLLALTHIPTNSGLIQDAVSVGRICKEFEILYLLDACQSVGQMEVDVREIGCDFLSMTGRKFMRGPRGTGFLFVSDSILEKGYAPLVMDSYGASWEDISEFKLKETAKRFEFWEKSDALKLGLKAAIDYALAVGLDNIQTYNSSLRKHFESELEIIDGISILDQGTQKASIITVTKEGVDLEQFQSVLDYNKVFYSVTRRQHALIDFDKKDEKWAMRFSPHYFNTPQELSELVEILDTL